MTKKPDFFKFIFLFYFLLFFFLSFFYGDEIIKINNGISDMLLYFISDDVFRDV